VQPALHGDFGLAHLHKAVPEGMVFSEENLAARLSAVKQQGLPK
jgi:hypothetical protein